MASWGIEPQLTNADAGTRRPPFARRFPVRSAQEFVITIWREESNQVGNEVEIKSNQVDVKSNQVGNEVEIKSNQVDVKSNQVEDLDTQLRHLDINHDTFNGDSDTDHDTFNSDSDTDHDTFNGDSDTKIRHSDTKRVSLSKKQKDIVNFCSVPRTSREILERVGVVYHTKNIAKYITSLVAAGYLQMTNPENPTASNQKYKKTTTK